MWRFLQAWGEEQTPAYSGCWGSVPSPLPIPEIFSETLYKVLFLFLLCRGRVFLPYVNDIVLNDK
jgi:hypothetical protein